MATSLTNNVLTFDHGSITDVINDMSIMVPISLDRKVTLSPRLAKSVTLSGSVGTVITDYIYEKSKVSATSNGGVWIFKYRTTDTQSTPKDQTLTVDYYPMFKDNDFFKIGTINVESISARQYSGMIFFAMRIG